MFLDRVISRFPLHQWYQTVVRLLVKDSGGTDYLVPLQVLNASGTVFTVTREVLNKDGTGFDVI